MYMVILRIKLPRNRRKDFLDAARMFSGRCRVQPGCLSCRFYQELDNTDTAILIQEWDSRTNLNDHMRSNEFRIILSLMELSSETPKFKLSTVFKTEGLEAIETARAVEFRV
jgi:quinol monooxygenase YgiN